MNEWDPQNLVQKLRFTSHHIIILEQQPHILEFRVAYLIFFMRVVIKLPQYFDNVNGVNDFEGLDIIV